MLQWETCGYLLAGASSRVIGSLDWECARDGMEAKDTERKVGEPAGEDAVKPAYWLTSPRYSACSGYSHAIHARKQHEQRKDRDSAYIGRYAAQIQVDLSAVLLAVLES